MNGITQFERFRGLSALQEHLNRLFEGSGPTPSDNSLSLLTAWAPAVDVYETENELVIKSDLPEISEKDLDVRVENHMLTIRGERKLEQKVREENYLCMERAYGSFSRSFSLPNTVSSEDIKAEYRDGVLTVTLLKRPEAKPKQIRINITNGKN